MLLDLCTHSSEGKAWVRYFLIHMGNLESTANTGGDDINEITSDPQDHVSKENSREDKGETEEQGKGQKTQKLKVSRPCKEDRQIPNVLERDSWKVEDIKRKETAVNHTAVNHTAVNQTAVTQTAVNQTAVNRTAVNRTAVNRTAVNRTAVNQSKKAPHDPSTGVRPNYLRSVKEFIKGFQKDHEYRMIEIRKKDHATKLGIALEGGIANPVIPGDPGIFIKSVLPGSPACGKLKKGDRIIIINGVNLTRVALKFAIHAINKAPETVQLYVKNAPKRQQTINSAMKADFFQGQHVFFSEQQLEEFQDAFSVFDKKGRGKIRASLVIYLIRSLGHNIDESLMDVYIDELELTVHRKLTFAEFVRLMSVVVQEQNQQSHVVDAIRVFDDEDSGFISVDEIKEAFERMPGNDRMRDFELKQIMRKARPDGEGKISAEDFTSLLMPTINLY